MNGSEKVKSLSKGNSQSNYKKKKKKTQKYVGFCWSSLGCFLAPATAPALRFRLIIYYSVSSFIILFSTRTSFLQSVKDADSIVPILLSLPIFLIV